MKTKILITIIILFSQVSFAQSFFEKSDAFFLKHVKDGLVNYSAIKSNSSELESLVRDIADFKIENPRSAETKAFI